MKSSQSSKTSSSVPAGRHSNPARVRQLICSRHEGQELVVHFVKRSTGRPRRMECRYRADVEGERSFSFSPVEKNLVPVFDLEKRDPRMVAADDVLVILVPATGRVYEGDDLRRDVAFEDDRPASRASASRSSAAGGHVFEEDEDGRPVFSWD